MEWPPRWLGTAYARLYEKFGEETFRLADARESLGPASNARAILPSLVKAGWALRTDHGRYMLLDPMLAVSTLQEKPLQERIPNTDYLPVVASFASSALRRMGRDLVSLALYGSVAAGRPSRTSDLDILLVANALPSPYSRRAPIVAELIRQTERARMELWRRKGLYPDLDVIALTPEEASVGQPIYLEMLESCIFVLDRKGFLKDTLRAFAGELAQSGARKVQTPGGLTYWMLEPGSKAGEATKT